VCVCALDICVHINATGYVQDGLVKCNLNTMNVVINHYTCSQSHYVTINSCASHSGTC